MKASIAIRRSRLTRRALFIGVNILIATLVYASVVAPVRALLVEGADRLAERQATLARYEAIASQENAVLDYIKKVRDNNARGELLEGASEGIVNANLQARLKASAEAAGVTLRSVQALPVKTLRGATLIGARLDVAGGVEAIHTLLRAIEGEAPLLLVTAATMRQQAAFWGAANTGEQLIESQFDVYGGALSKERI